MAKQDFPLTGYPVGVNSMTFGRTGSGYHGNRISGPRLLGIIAVPGVDDGPGVECGGGAALRQPSVLQESCVQATQLIFNVYTVETRKYTQTKSILYKVLILNIK